MFTLPVSKRWIRRAGFAVLVVSLLLAMLPSVALAAPPALPMRGAHGGNCANHYVVHRGETLSGIAARSGVSVWALREANGIGNPNRIYAGQWLCIPHGYPGHPGGPGQPGHPGGPGHHGNVYTIRAGDTLSAIAWRFGTSVWWLMQINHIHNPNHIYAGQVLRVG